MSIAIETRDFKQQVMSNKTHWFGAAADPRALSIFVMSKVIPKMEELKEVAFCYDFLRKDVAAQTQRSYDLTIAELRSQKWKCDKGDTIWHYDFKCGDKMRRCVMTTEVWYHPKKEYPTSPFALAMGQVFSAGHHVVKCQFTDAPA